MLGVHLELVTLTIIIENSSTYLWIITISLVCVKMQGIEWGERATSYK